MEDGFVKFRVGWTCRHPIADVVQHSTFDFTTRRTPRISQPTTLGCSDAVRQSDCGVADMHRTRGQPLVPWLIIMVHKPGWRSWHLEIGIQGVIFDCRRWRAFPIYHMQGRVMVRPICLMLNSRDSRSIGGPGICPGKATLRVVIVAEFAVSRAGDKWRADMYHSSCPAYYWNDPSLIYVALQRV